MARLKSREGARRTGGICEPWDVSRALGLHGPLYGGEAGSELLLDGLEVSGDDDIVEYWPGYGLTTRRILPLRPRSYRGIAPDQRTADRLDDRLRRHPDLRSLTTRRETDGAYTSFRVACAEATGLPDQSASAVLGENLLTPLAPFRVRSVLREVWRLLPPGGRFGVHELCLVPEPSWDDRRDRERAAELLAEIERSAGPGLHPRTEAGWRAEIERSGMVVTGVRTAPLAPLTRRRLIRELGARGALEVTARMVANSAETLRLRALADVLRANRADLGAIILIAERPLIGDLLLPDD